jgi:hypothetical protein
MFFEVLENSFFSKGWGAWYKFLFFVDSPILDVGLLTVAGVNCEASD